MQKKKLAGVTIFSVLVLMSSLMHMGKLIEDTDVYFKTYAYLPGWLTTTRYCFSWFQRVLGISAAILALLYKEIGRKLLLLIGVFTITTVYWKHPYVAVERFVYDMQGRYPVEAQAFSLESIALAATISLCFLDVLFQGILIFYFTRDGVKKAFKKP
ncbi:MAG: hypothetical protein K8I00_04230 [Candidatus Omnitrophica bacterium]|nr:hypothetical protein [Candidatus Omnitrophota bacterium]